MTSGPGPSAKGSLGSQLSLNTTREGCKLPGQAAGEHILSLPDGPTGKNTLATGPSVWNLFSPMHWTHSEAPGSFYIPVFTFHSLGSVLKNSVRLYRAETCLFSLRELQPLEAFHVGGLTCVPSLTLALPQEGRCTLRNRLLGPGKCSIF